MKFLTWKTITDDETYELQMWKEVEDRELGRIKPALLATVCSPEFAKLKESISAHKGL